MADLIFVVLALVFFLGAARFLKGCDRLSEASHE